jgi:hypothetical protein
MMIKKAKIKYDISCAGSGHAQILFTSKLSSLYVNLATTRNK